MQFNFSHVTLNCFGFLALLEMTTEKQIDALRSFRTAQSVVKNPEELRVDSEELSVSVFNLRANIRLITPTTISHPVQRRLQFTLALKYFKSNFQIKARRMFQAIKQGFIGF